MKHQVKLSPDHQKLYQLAEQQAGYFSTRQARTVGLTRPLLSYYTKTGYLHRIQRGIYRLSRFPEMPFADLFVAWLAAGPGAVISHESALAVYDISDVLPSEIHITVPRTASRRGKEMRLHTKQLRKSEITQRAGLPVTTIARTLADLAISGLGEEQIRLAISQTLERGLITREALKKDAQKRGGRVARLILKTLLEMAS